MKIIISAALLGATLAMSTVITPSMAAPQTSGTDAQPLVLVSGWATRAQEKRHTNDLPWSYGYGSRPAWGGVYQYGGEPGYIEQGSPYGGPDFDEAY